MVFQNAIKATRNSNKIRHPKLLYIIYASIADLDVCVQDKNAYAFLKINENFGRGRTVHRG